MTHYCNWRCYDGYSHADPYEERDSAMTNRNDIAADFHGRHPGTVGLLRHFANDHLPEPLKTISGECADLAARMAHTVPDGPELTTGLRKLLEAKDCFVRAELDRPSP